ncbi:MAG: hypothetical protein Q9162_006375 [Coniocarpon cinnabarinum]
MLSYLLCVAVLLARVCLAADAATWRSHSIYQVLTDRFAQTDGSTSAPCNVGDRVYCGGSWQGITNQLDYIHGMGFTAIWISPVTLNLPQQTGDGSSYHGYWQQNIYEINSNFGTADDLRALSSALHARGMLLMVDIVVNHNGWNGDSSSVDYSTFYPFNDQDSYHTYCAVTNYDDVTNRDVCWLGDQTVPLVDLKTEDQAVRTKYQDWIKSLVANYSIDGLRVDTMMYVEYDFWPSFQEAAGVFITGEVDDPSADTICSYQGGVDSVLNYAVYFQLVAAFKSTSGDIGALANMVNSVKDTCKDSTVLGSFSENHDNPRFANYTTDMALAQNVLAFTILADGIPIVYAGQEQHYEGGNDPYNREATWLSSYSTTAPLYTHVAKLNQIRARAIAQNDTYLTYQNYPIYTDTSTLAMRKGFDGNQIVTVLSNLGADGAKYTLSLNNTGYTAGEKLVEVMACQDVTVDGSGNVPVAMADGGGAGAGALPGGTGGTGTGTGVGGPPEVSAARVRAVVIPKAQVWFIVVLAGLAAS